jgi:hypothetical protein
VRIARLGPHRPVATEDGRSGRWLWWAAGDCHARGHELCAARHAAEELKSAYGDVLSLLYVGPVQVLTLIAPGWGLQATRRAAERLLAGARVRAAVGLVVGYLMACGGREPGYGVALMLPDRAGQAERAVLLREWRALVPCGWIAPVDDLPNRPSAMEAFVELRVRSEQALPLLVAAGDLSPEQGARWLMEEIGANGIRALGHGPQRLIASPGVQALRRDLRVGHVRAVAAGEETAAMARGSTYGPAEAAPNVHAHGPQAIPPRAAACGRRTYAAGLGAAPNARSATSTSDNAAHRGPAPQFAGAESP